MNETVDAVALAGSVAQHDLSMWGLFLQADPIVKTVMILLMSASVWSWAIIFHKRSQIAMLNRRANRFEDSFWSGESLDKIYQRVKNSKPDPMLATFSTGMEEWQTGVAGGMPAKESLQASLRQRVERAMSVTIGREMDLLERGMTFLASIGSVAPFIGLFGTVWGIMNSFSSIAATNNTSLAVVAPGIAEALFATALGLVAAIPAVVAYNVFSTALNRYGARLEAFTDEFTAILSRHLDSLDSNGNNSRKAA
ncbi:MAG: protein TolQ [Alphaproteobacteria bacterium]|nr:protein TolQ [Alphaproteobacteria bacterium]MCD8525751.1 protein TolQ [Alphaproteobacteria bacterium]MCD8570593.1 protein TolQ [Alphaproteobacteria bacterium]